MKSLLPVVLIFWSSQSLALEQYWIEDKSDGTRHACYSPGFFAMLRGDRTCAPYNGNNPPDRARLRVLATAPKEQVDSHAAVTRRIAEINAAALKVAKEIQAQEDRLARLKNQCREVSRVRQNECNKSHADEIARGDEAVAVLSQSIESLSKVSNDLGQALAQANAEAKDIEERAKLANHIIASKDVLARLDRLDHRLDKASDTLNSIERAFERTLLEAYLNQKMQKMAANFCEASQQCSSAGDDAEKREAAQKQLLDKVFDDERIQSDAKRPASTQPAAR